MQKKHHGSAADQAALKGMSPFDEFIITSGAGVGNKYEHRGGAGWVQTQTYDATGAASVSDTANPMGIVRTRFVSVTGDTTPTLAGSGCMTFAAPGVKGVECKSVRIVSGHAALLALIVAGATNLIVRVAIDAANDAAALAMLPDAFPASSATADLGQITTFNLIATIVSAALDTGRAIQLSIDPATPVNIGLTNPVTRVDVVHELTAVVLQFEFSAAEGV